MLIEWLRNFLPDSGNDARLPSKKSMTLITWNKSWSAAGTQLARNWLMRLLTSGQNNCCWSYVRKTDILNIACIDSDLQWTFWQILWWPLLAMSLVLMLFWVIHFGSHWLSLVLFYCLYSLLSSKFRTFWWNRRTIGLVVAKLRYCKLCAVFSGPPFSSTELCHETILRHHFPWQTSTVVN